MIQNSLVFDELEMSMNAFTHSLTLDGLSCNEPLIIVGESTYSKVRVGGFVWPWKKFSDGTAIIPWRRSPFNCTEI